MITAERFATTNGTYWNRVLPRLEGFIRLSNRGPIRLARPMKSTSAPGRQTYVTETGFQLWAQMAAARNSNYSLRRAMSSAKASLQHVSDQVEMDEPLGMDEARAAVMLARRLMKYIREVRRFTDIAVEPHLAGCGNLSGGKPDLIAVDRSTVLPLVTIAEFKAVDRAFRSTDVRQLVAYTVLYYGQYRRMPDLVSIVNPLRGTALEVGVEDLFLDVVGLPADDVVSELLVEWSSAGISQ